MILAFSPARLGLIGVSLLALGAAGGLIAARTTLGAYLAAWWFWLGLSLGSAANIWLHALTGGAWARPLRAPLVAAARQLPWLALLFIPVLIGSEHLYSWTHPEVAHRPGVAAKSGWLNLPFFVVRSLVYLALWTGIGLLARRAAFGAATRWAAAGLLVYGFSVSFAAIDWLMSLMPRWYSTNFGLIAGVGQMLGAFAFGILIAWLQRRAPPPIFRDLGNLLLMYVMTWAYLAFVQFLIIWAENLPDEIAWYLPRLDRAWLWAAWMLVVFHFFVPLLILLFRHAKEVPRLLGLLALSLLAMHALDVTWLILPSIPVEGRVAAWTTPVLLAGLGCLWFAGWRRDMAEAEQAGMAPEGERQRA